MREQAKSSSRDSIASTQGDKVCSSASNLSQIMELSSNIRSMKKLSIKNKNQIKRQQKASRQMAAFKKISELASTPDVPLEQFKDVFEDACRRSVRFEQKIQVTKVVY